MQPRNDLSEAALSRLQPLSTEAGKMPAGQTARMAALQSTRHRPEALTTRGGL